jgi:hypothetical protein
MNTAIVVAGKEDEKRHNETVRKYWPCIDQSSPSCFERKTRESFFKEKNPFTDVYFTCNFRKTPLLSHLHHTCI